MKACGLVEPLDNRTVNREASAAERLCSRSSGDQAVLRVGENLELFTQLLAEAVFNCIVSPRVQIRVPGRAVIESKRWNSSQSVVRPVPIGQVSRQSLTLRIVA